MKYAIGLMLLLTAVLAQAAVDTKNLLKNGDFEETGTPLPGWRISADAGESYELSSNAVGGKNALKISLPAAGGSVTAVSEPAAVTGGDDYLFTYWSRGDGDKKGGVVCAYIIWQDNTGKGLDTTWASYYGTPAPDYRAATYIVTAPAGAAQCLVRYVASVNKDYQGPATTFFFDQARLMKMSKVSVPADAQKWEYVNRVVSSGTKMVDDKDAANGQVIAAEAGVTAKNDYLAFGPYTREQPVGEYLAVFRLKVKDNTKKEPVVSLDVAATGSINSVIAGPKIVYAADFKQPGVYQDVALRFVKPEEGTLEFRVCYQGATDLSYDKVTVVQLATFATEKEQAAIWLGE